MHDVPDYAGEFVCPCPVCGEPLPLHTCYRRRAKRTVLCRACRATIVYSWHRGLIAFRPGPSLRTPAAHAHRSAPLPGRPKR